MSTDLATTIKPFAFDAKPTGGIVVFESQERMELAYLRDEVNKAVERGAKLVLDENGKLRILAPVFAEI